MAVLCSRSARVSIDGGPSAFFFFEGIFSKANYFLDTTSISRI
jgi:hypothetical protein